MLVISELIAGCGPNLSPLPIIRPPQSRIPSSQAQCAIHSFGRLRAGSMGEESPPCNMDIPPRHIHADPIRELSNSIAYSARHKRPPSPFYNPSCSLQGALLSRERIQGRSAMSWAETRDSQPSFFISQLNSQGIQCRFAENVVDTARTSFRRWKKSTFCQLQRSASRGDEDGDGGL